MKSACFRFGLVLLAIALCHSAARAFPPAPDGLLYGMVKDQYGMPLQNTADTVILITPGGVQEIGFVQPNLAIGVNYMVDVPMDTGLTAQPYVTNALVAGAQFKLLVVTGGATNLPIEMTGTNLVLANPSVKTLQNLTLGTDTNVDGIPDQWLAAFLADIGSSLSPASLNANGIYTKDGRTLLQEYLLGNYPFNPTGDFSVQIVSQSAGSVVLAFTTMTGRTYTAFGSPDLKNWTQLSFTIPAAGPANQTSYYSSTIQPLKIQTVAPATGPQMQFFRLLLQ